MDLESECGKFTSLRVALPSFKWVGNLVTKRGAYPDDRELDCEPAPLTKEGGKKGKRAV